MDVENASHSELAVRLINENRENLYSDGVVTAESHRAFVCSLPKEDYLWVVCREDEPCGIVSVYHDNLRDGRCEWGRFVIDDSFRRAGAMVEFMILEFVFGKMERHKLFCEVFEQNAAVISLHQKFGFREEGKFIDHIFKAGTFRSVVYLAMFASEWKIARPRFEKMFADKVGTIEE
jgi:UDP-4-amino-4,6-dideoxy-N-acetyl-beta-L-altrosamine N-acetyltransferase